MLTSTETRAPARRRWLRVVLLLVGIPIFALGLLAGIAVVFIGVPNPNVAKTAITASIISPKGTIPEVILLYCKDMGHLPRTLRELVERPADKIENARWLGPYIENVDYLTDAWNQPFRFHSGSSAIHNIGSFDLWSIGPDGIDGTSDDICNWTKP